MDDDATRVSSGSLGRDERRVLAALSVVASASLSTDELADVTAIPDVASVLDGLRRTGLVRTDARDRHALLGPADELRESAQALSSADRLRKYFETLARRGRLTAARAGEDAGAIEGLAGWLAEHGRWEDLLELVQTVEPSFAVPETRLLRGGIQAARAVGDAAAETVFLERLGEAPAPAAAAVPVAAPLARPAPPPPRSNPWRVVALVLSLLAAAGIGVAAGILVSGNTKSHTTTTSIVPVTVSLPGQTVVTIQTATLPAETLTETLATTETVVTTVVTTATAP